MTDLRLETTHTHLYPGARGHLYGALPEPAPGRGVTCEVAFADGSVALGSLVMGSGTEAVLEVGPHTTAAGSDIPAKKWRLEIADKHHCARAFRVRARLALSES